MYSAHQNNNSQTSQGSKANSGIAGFFNIMRKGLKAASAAQAYRYDKEAILKILSEDK